MTTSESYTGGVIASKITSIAESFDYYLGTIVTYHTDLKRALFSVPASLIEKHTVVSRAVAEAMAKGVPPTNIFNHILCLRFPLLT
ncbi:MAG: CinA family protein [Flavobacteriales bacterium]